MASGDAQIGHLINVLQREANGEHAVQAGGWKDLQAAFTVFTDVLQRHMTSLETNWPQTNPASQAFMGRLQELITPVQDAADYAASENARAITTIHSAASDAVSSMQGNYQRSAQINQRWDNLSAQPNPPTDADEIQLMKQQGSLYSQVNAVMEQYKTDVVSTPMSQPPTYNPPHPAQYNWDNNPPGTGSPGSGSGNRGGVTTVPGGGRSGSVGPAPTSPGGGGPVLAGGGNGGPVLGGLPGGPGGGPTPIGGQPGGPGPVIPPIGGGGGGVPPVRPPVTVPPVEGEPVPPGGGTRPPVEVPPVEG